MNLKKIYDFKNIVVVGVSKKRREGCLTYMPDYPVDNGYNVIPVNPKTSES